MKKIDEITKKLKYQRKNFWKEFPKTEQKKALNFSEGYKKFLDNCKTDRESIDVTIKAAVQNKYSDLDNSPKGDKLYRSFRKKNAGLALIGKRPISDGVNLIVSHIDVPRVDLKQNPLFEDGTTSLGMMKTHYYGGIKKYQWLSTPLALHGIVRIVRGKSVLAQVPEPIPCVEGSIRIGGLVAVGVSLVDR